MFQCTSPEHVGKWNALSRSLSRQYSLTLLRASRLDISFKVDKLDNLTNKDKDTWQRYKGVDKLDNLTNSGSNNDPRVQPAAEVLHRERGKGDVPPSLQLYQVADWFVNIEQNKY